ncbi:T9SS type A sorting domain-containing protein [Hymenobacter sp. 15J16-1T3B]|uniref:T9SS type A sorting domain-containing protein n=1 Tax=Hymenobacter sp. 15J16-1T3B TaxID=2886941 RepID=UPI001D1063E1|nr:T9SS type A sorting domain-containing protein [Hymenobacter sp. 15J16-1T3B]MCC3156404.1 T9SS type A sorting domain-containing protein [Hymenobacter sp. 15J16-1T3B]
MHHLYRLALGAGLLLQALAVRGQIVLSNFNPNTQDFNTLTTSTAATPPTYTNNATMLGLYLGSNVYFQNSPTFPYPSGFYDYTPDRLGANDGSVTTAQFYSLGSAGSTDRAIGGLATGQSGTGWAGLRYKNNTGATIKNLAVTYTMEQWYNSGTIDQANFQVHYRTGTTVTSVYQSSGTWTAVSQLGVFAPSTTKPITNQNGNVASNRVTLSYTIPNVNLANGAEIMLRWTYSLNNSTNGNGLGIDDVTVTPESTIFYSKANGDYNNRATWGPNADGTGTPPSNFTDANQIFYVRGVAPTTDRLGGASWTVSGTNSKIVVGQDGAPAKMLVAAGADINGTVDVATGSTLRIEKTNSSTLRLGTLNVGSTVEYIGTADHTVQPKQYSRLRVIGTGGKNLGGDVTVTDTLSFRGGADLALGAYDLTLSSLGAIVGSSPTSFVVTNGKGKLRLPVAGLSNGTSTAVVFPVGTDATSYSPVSIQQNTAQSQDIFEVRVINNVYHRYNANEEPLGPAVQGEVVKKTWFVSKETPTIPNVDVQLAMEWNSADATADFVPAQAFVDHFTGGQWDRVTNRPGATQPRANAHRVARGGISSFSPFGVSSSGNGVLPVALLGFDAKRTAGTVTSTWATATEQNNARFEVERSLDGKAFETLGTVAGAGNSTQRRDYSFVDAHPAAGLAYYRLRQVDNDGTETLSNVVAVAAVTDKAAALTVSPNPGTGLFEVWTDAPAGTPLQLTVQTVLGTEVLRQRLTATAQRPQLDLRRLPAGVYYVRVRSAAGQHTARVVKQ